jgi:hypothetical protein
MTCACEAARRLGVSEWYCVEHGAIGCPSSVDAWALKLGRDRARELFIRDADAKIDKAIAEIMKILETV